MSNYSIADKSTPTQLHGERGKVLKAVDNDLGSLAFEVSQDRDGPGANLVLWEKRGTLTWGIPVYDFTNRKDADAVAKTLNGLVQSGILRPGPLLSTNDSVADAPSFKVGRGGALGGVGVKLAGGGPGGVWAVEVHYLKDKEAAQGLSKSLNHLLAGKVLRAKQKFVIPFASEEGRNLRILHWEGVDETITRLADNAPESVHALKAVTDAAPKVDPNTKILNPSPVDSRDPRFLPLKALDNAGVYGKDIEGLYQICGRHPGKMVAVLRATALGLIDAPAIQAALKPVGMLRVGGLDVDGITKAVEAAVPEFSAARVPTPPLTAAETPNVSADIKRHSREGHAATEGHRQEGK
jgi:hypothetical protein